MKLSLADRLHMRHRLWRYRFRSEEWHNIRYLLQSGVAGTTMLDIGANRGIYSYYMSKVAGPSGHVFAFEAQPELGAHLNALKETYGLDNLTVVNQGLSSSSGTRKMKRISAGWSGAGFHDIGHSEFEEIDVPVVTLDEALGEGYTDPVSFIKCDVEKHEYEVFRGGEQTLLRFMPTLLFEGHDSAADMTSLFGYLTDLGYDGFFFFIDPSDHAGFLPNRKGKFVHFSKFRDYPYIKPGIRHRDYIFLKKGRTPDYM